MRFDHQRAQKFENDFDVLTIGAPLLTTIDDYEQVARTAISELPEMKEGEARLYGTRQRHHANTLSGHGLHL